MNNELLEVVDQYKYLGALFTKNGKINEEIKHRIKQATNIYYQINQTIIGKTEIDTKTKLQIYKTVYTPTLLYGAESWPTNDKINQQIQAAEMKYLRRVANKTKRDKERNTKIRETLKVTPIGYDIENRQLKWYGHVKRMDKNRIPRKCLEARIEGKRSRGRPRRTWLDSVITTGKNRNKTLSELNNLCMDRKEWKKWIEKDPTP